MNLEYRQKYWLEYSLLAGKENTYVVAENFNLSQSTTNHEKSFPCAEKNTTCETHTEGKRHCHYGHWYYHNRHSKSLLIKIPPGPVCNQKKRKSCIAGIPDYINTWSEICGMMGDDIMLPISQA